MKTEDVLHFAAELGFAPRNAGLFVTGIVMLGDTRVDSSVHQRPSDETRLGRSGSGLKGDKVNSIRILNNSGVTSENESTLSGVPRNIDRDWQLEIKFVFSKSIALLDHHGGTIDVAGGSLQLIELEKREDEHGFLTGVVERNVIDAVTLSVVDGKRTAAPIALGDGGASRSIIDLADANIGEAELIIEVPAARIRAFTLRLRALGLAGDDVLGTTATIDPLTGHILDAFHQ